MSNSGKLMILGYLAKVKTGTFRQRHVVQATSLSRQLVNYHLEQLTNSGVIEKLSDSSFYKVANEEALVNLLVESAETGPALQKRLKHTQLLNELKVNGFNVQLEVYMALRALDYSYHSDIKLGMMEKLNETIDNLNSMRRYLKAVQPSNERRGAGNLEKLRNSDESDDLWNSIAPYVPETKKSFETWLEDRLSEVKENV